MSPPKKPTVHRTRYKTELARRGLFIRLPLNGVPDDNIILYRAILDRFLLDCFSKDATIAKECKCWFSLENEIFIETCDYADLELDFVVEHVKKAYKLIKKEQDSR